MCAFVCKNFAKQQISASSDLGKHVIGSQLTHRTLTHTHTHRKTGNQRGNASNFASVSVSVSCVCVCVCQCRCRCTRRRGQVETAEDNCGEVRQGGITSHLVAQAQLCRDNCDGAASHRKQTCKMAQGCLLEEAPYVGYRSIPVYGVLIDSRKHLCSAGLCNGGVLIDWNKICSCAMAVSHNSVNSC